MAKSVRPLGDRILVRRIESAEKTEGGILIPDNAKEKPAEGEIIAVGNGKTTDDGALVKPSLKSGDRVLFGKWSGTEVKIDGEERLLMKEEDVLAVLES